MKYIELQYIEIKQNIGNFYITKMTPKQLHAIANKNLSRYRNAEEGIQRDLSEKRTKEIKKYLEEEKATFPNSIILAVTSDPSLNKDSNYKIDADKISILNKDGVVNIIDGQHRLSGLSADNENFELPVAIFLDLSLGEQAKIFSKINSTQSKVSLDLVYELFSLSKGRSPEKVAYSIVNTLNFEENSPWFKKIKTLSDRSGDMAQGSFSKYIDKQFLSEGKLLANIYSEERDRDLLIMLKNYFNVFKDIFPVEWENINSKYILTKTTGFVGLMSFFGDLIKLSRKSNEAFTFEYCYSHIKNAKEFFQELNSHNYPSGATGQNKIKETLRKGLSKDQKKMIGIKIIS
jgi:DGQHR domain-containing protein